MKPIFWDIFWSSWVLLAVLVEVNRLLARDYVHTLTGFMRRIFLYHPAGTAFVSAFLAWLLWHWIYDDENPHFEDVIVLLLGVGVGIGGWLRRRSLKKRQESEVLDSKV